MKKIYALALAALVFAACEPKNNPVDPENPADTTEVTPGDSLTVLTQKGMMIIGLSANHKYAVGKSEDDKPVLWNTETGEVVSTTTPGVLNAVNNDGIAVGAAGDVEEFAYRFVNGEVESLYVPEGAKGSAAWDITDDGSMIVGFFYNSDFKTVPCYWTADRNYHELPIPTEEEVGFEISGAGVRWVSADGSVILGYLLDNFSTWPVAVWNRQGDGSYVCDPICKDYFEDDYNKGKPYMEFGMGGSGDMSLSKNGQWITLTTQVEYDAYSWDVPTPDEQACRFNLVSRKLDKSDVNVFTCITNDGTCLGYNGESPITRTAYVWFADEAQPKAFVESLDSPVLKDVKSCSPLCITPDATAAAGYAYDANSSLFGFVICY